MKPETLKLNRLREIGLVVVSLLLIVPIGAMLYQRSKVHYLSIGAGSHTGESFILCSALRNVVERHYSRIKITVLETGGTVESLKLLDKGRVALAAAQADVLPGTSARIVVVLYDDTFQLLTREGSPVQSFADLRGRTIALPKTGGQFQSFLTVASHFGLGESDFHFIGATDADANRAFVDGSADAIFAVRALGNPSLQQLVQSGNVRMVRIDHAAAMKIDHPAFDPAVIPAGAYMGNPAVPPEDLPSISIHRTLLASADVDDDTIRAITEMLLDRRQEIAEEIPGQSAAVRLLLAHVRRPDVRTELGPAVHPGALRFYDQDKPSFVQAHADYIGLLLTIIVMVSSWIWELKAWLLRQQKNVADDYSNRVVALIGSAEDATSRAALEEIRGQLLNILTSAVADLDSDRISEEAFQSFRAVLQIGLELVRDRWGAMSGLAATATRP